MVYNQGYVFNHYPNESYNRKHRCKIGLRQVLMTSGGTGWGKGGGQRGQGASQGGKNAGGQGQSMTQLNHTTKNQDKERVLRPPRTTTKLNEVTDFPYNNVATRVPNSSSDRAILKVVRFD
jgi:hypothetical protein